MFHDILHVILKVSSLHLGLDILFSFKYPFPVCHLCIILFKYPFALLLLRLYFQWHRLLLLLLCYHLRCH